MTSKAFRISKERESQIEDMMSEELQYFKRLRVGKNATCLREGTQIYWFPTPKDGSQKDVKL